MRWRHITRAMSRFGSGCRQGDYQDIAEFVESIPYTETREYVQAILRNREMYRALYSHSNVNQSEDLFLRTYGLTGAKILCSAPEVVHPRPEARTASGGLFRSLKNQCRRMNVGHERRQPLG